ncbi:hypothetical protein RRG08_056796 [Elysia crispata]|uniref:Uncharacterized protein n=1 Tax=Elysia crispata TaxID=231223 RepID=A0AAE1AC28_9GAST|nr:hypothetical protein RRG08_056796 [Elysia crispata]
MEQAEAAAQVEEKTLDGCPKRFYRNMKLNEKGRGKTTVQRWLAGSDLDKDILVLLHAVISVEEQRGWKIED